jgi:ribonuclease HII
MLAQYFQSKNTIEAGVDEAGRGCLAGPVYAAAVVLPSDFEFALLNDSKKLSEKDRIKCKEYIEQYAISYAVASVSNVVIDKINILQASYKAMHLAIGKLSVLPELLLIDGNRFKPYKRIAHHCIIKGDGKINSIAAASILAKTYRDEYMYSIANQYAIYNWYKNKGYPTLQHRQTILDNGYTKYHRKTFVVQVAKAKELFD